MSDDVFSSTEHRMKRAVEILLRDFGNIRTGRASASLLDRVQVEYYGTPTPINNLATVNAPEPRLLVIQPWDRTTLPAIEKAILKSDLGLNPSSDGTVIRLSLPQLTEDRRRDLVKQVHRRAEEGRVAIRNVRREAQDDFRKQEREKSISEDDLKRASERVQKLTDSYIAQVDETARRKEHEVMEV